MGVKTEKYRRISLDIVPAIRYTVTTEIKGILVFFGRISDMAVKQKRQARRIWHGKADVYGDAGKDENL